MFFPDTPLIIPSPKNKRYLRSFILILLGYSVSLLLFLFIEGLFASSLLLLQLLAICSTLYTLYYGMFAFITGCSLLNLGHMLANVGKYNVTVGFVMVVFFIYASYYSYMLYVQMKEQYEE